jgi:hypothetical protein
MKLTKINIGASMPGLAFIFIAIISINARALECPDDSEKFCAHKWCMAILSNYMTSHEEEKSPDSYMRVMPPLEFKLRRVGFQAFSIDDNLYIFNEKQVLEISESSKKGYLFQIENPNARRIAGGKARVNSQRIIYNKEKNFLMAEPLAAEPEGFGADKFDVGRLYREGPKAEEIKEKIEQKLKENADSALKALDDGFRADGITKKSFTKLGEDVEDCRVSLNKQMGARANKESLEALDVSLKKLSEKAFEKNGPRLENTKSDAKGVAK